MARHADDRTVHVTLRDGREVVRYDRAGQWYIEHPGGRRFRLLLADAVSWALDTGAQWHEGRPGGLLFDRAVRRAQEASQGVH